MKDGHERPVNSPRLTKTDSLRPAEQLQSKGMDNIQPCTPPDHRRGCRFLRVEAEHSASGRSTRR
jgi:hypothetical protein